MYVNEKHIYLYKFLKRTQIDIHQIPPGFDIGVRETRKTAQKQVVEW